MRALLGLILILTLLTGCGTLLGDGPPAVPTVAPIVASAIDARATATRGTASATRSVTVVAGTPGVTTATRTASSIVPTATPTPRPPTATPVPPRPGPPVVTPGAAATPGTPGAASPVAATPRVATPNAGGTPATPRSGTPMVGGTPGTPTTGAVDQNRTATQIFAPYRPDGLVKSLRVTATVNGYCVGGAQTLPGRPDAWRCATGGRILDPCFASTTPDTQPLACADTPWSDEITLLNLTAPLPRDRANGSFSVSAAPWGFQLANGARCQATPGGNSAIAGMPITAVCSDGGQVLGDPDRGGGRWRVFVGRDDTPNLELQEIVAVWY